VQVTAHEVKTPAGLTIGLKPLVHTQAVRPALGWLFSTVQAVHTPPAEGLYEPAVQGWQLPAWSSSPARQAEGLMFSTTTGALT
jgi:hypothetical protein